jgi:hypothetical protein
MLAPSLRALRVATPTLYRGQHQRPGKARCAVFLEEARSAKHLTPIHTAINEGAST